MRYALLFMYRYARCSRALCCKAETLGSQQKPSRQASFDHTQGLFGENAIIADFAEF